MSRVPKRALQLLRRADLSTREADRLSGYRRTRHSIVSKQLDDAKYTSLYKLLKREISKNGNK